MEPTKNDNKINKYKNGRIYKITDNNYTEMYIGSTIQRLSKRLSEHKTSYKRYKDGKGNNVTIFNLFDKYGIDDCKIELIENYPCNSNEELHKQEGFHIQNTNCVNRCIAGRTLKETCANYYKKNKDKIKEYYNNNNKKIKAYREANKEKKKLLDHKRYLKKKQAKQNDN